MTTAMPVFVPTSRPIARFATALMIIGAVAAALWWSGLFAARVDIVVSEGFDPSESSGTAVVSLTNEGPLDVHATGVDLEARRDGRFYEPPVRLVDQQPDGRIAIPAGGSVRFTIRYIVDCGDADRLRRSEGSYVTPSLRVRVDVEGAVAGDRAVRSPELALNGACEEPIDQNG